MNGPKAAPSNVAEEVTPLTTNTLPRTESGGQISSYESILARSPQHEPWPHHENLDPLSFKKIYTDRDSPGALPSADRIVTPDTFDKNFKAENRVDMYKAAAAIISTGNSSRPGGSGQTPVPPGDYNSDYVFDENIGALSEKIRISRQPCYYWMG